MSTPTGSMERFAIAGHLSLGVDRHGLLRIEVANAQATAQIYLYGAHVAHFQPHGQQPVLWMSTQSLFVPGKPIRGGVPICWPWFGPHTSDSNLPIHGFVRTRLWTLEETATLSDGRTRVVLALRSDDETRRFWPHEFALRYTVTVGRTLELDLRSDNPGTLPFICAEALHTYLTVGDVRQIRVGGLGGATYVDKVRKGERFTEAGDVTITGETDRVYLGTAAACTIDDPLLTRRLVIAKEGSQATVVWNPWIAKAKAMADFGDDEWPGMVCVETVNALDHALTIPAGGSHHLVARISAQSPADQPVARRVP
jgi:glucose-6-phosphate 1-epimerase